MLFEELPKNPHPERPYVIIMSALTIDGKMTIKKGASSREFAAFVKPDLLQEVHHLRALCDGIMVGANTIVIDDSNLTVRFAKGRNPIRVIPDPEGLIPLEAKVLTDGEAPTIIAVSEQMPSERIQKLRSAGVEVVVSGSGRFVDFPLLMGALAERGIQHLMVEGGGTLNWFLLKSKLVDEVCIARLPLVVGGSQTPTFAEGPGIEKKDDVVRLEHLVSQERDGIVLSRYRVIEA